MFLYPVSEVSFLHRVERSFIVLAENQTCKERERRDCSQGKVKDKILKAFVEQYKTLQILRFCQQIKTIQILIIFKLFSFCHETIKFLK